MCDQCLQENPHYIIEATPFPEVDYDSKLVKKVQSTLARADPNRNDNKPERDIAARQANKLIGKTQLKDNQMQFLWNLTDRIDYWFRTKLGINAKQKAIELAQDANPTIKNNKK